MTPTRASRRQSLSRWCGSCFSEASAIPRRSGALGATASSSMTAQSRPPVGRAAPRVPRSKIGARPAVPRASGASPHPWLTSGQVSKHPWVQREAEAGVAEFADGSRGRIEAVQTFFVASGRRRALRGGGTIAVRQPSAAHSALRFDPTLGGHGAASRCRLWSRTLRCGGDGQARRRLPADLPVAQALRRRTAPRAPTPPISRRPAAGTGTGATSSAARA